MLVFYKVMFDAQGSDYGNELMVWIDLQLMSWMRRFNLTATLRLTALLWRQHELRQPSTSENNKHNVLFFSSALKFESDHSFFQ